MFYLHISTGTDFTMFLLHPYVSNNINNSNYTKSKTSLFFWY